MLVILVLLFLLPTCIAVALGRKNWFAIMLVNLLFGLSGIGWAIALIWACIKDEK